MAKLELATRQMTAPKSTTFASTQPQRSYNDTTALTGTPASAPMAETRLAEPNPRVASQVTAVPQPTSPVEPAPAVVAAEHPALAATDTNPLRQAGSLPEPSGMQPGVTLPSQIDEQVVRLPAPDREFLATPKSPVEALSPTSSLPTEPTVEPDAALAARRTQPADASATPDGLPRLAYVPYRNENVMPRQPAARRAEREAVERLPEVGPSPATVAGSPAPTCGESKTWQEPQTLLDHLEGLGGDQNMQNWAGEARRLVEQFGRTVNVSGGDGSSPELVLTKLEKLNGDAATMAGKMDDRAAARQLRQVSYSITRRIDLWRQYLHAAKSGTAQAPAAAAVDQLSVCLADVDSITGDSDEGRAWKRYLMYDVIRDQAQRRSADGQRLSQTLVQEVLRRVNSSDLTPAQRQFLASRPVASLELALRRASTEPVDPAVVLEHVEQYERTRLPSDARRLAMDCQALALSPVEAQRQLGRRLEMHYRNANVRFVVNDKLLNRIMPQRGPEFAPVYERIQGTPVVGRSLVSSDVAVRLVPDPGRVRLALEINGEMASFTSSTSGPATFYDRGNTTYVARKPLEIDLNGVHAEPSQVQVFANSKLQDVETDYDGVPLLGPMANRIAMQQYAQHKAAAEREIRWKVARKARERIDTEAQAQFDQATTKLRDDVVSPLHQLDLEPKLIGAETTEERIAMRVRLAGNDQLGGYTARPQAPGDSWASLQVHESAINNSVQRLQLDGRTFTLPELSKHIAAHINGMTPWDADPDYDDVSITFAAHDAINVRFDDGQMAVTLGIAKLAKGSRAWRDFQVRANYKPQVEGRTAELYRDGIIHLSGPNLTTGAQMALRGVFSKTFSRKSPWTITPETLTSNPDLADLSVTQFTIDDGWLGLALGPKRTAMSRSHLFWR